MIVALDAIGYLGVVRLLDLSPVHLSHTVFPYTQLYYSYSLDYSFVLVFGA
jgi:hypothetical protein